MCVGSPSRAPLARPSAPQAGGVSGSRCACSRTCRGDVTIGRRWLPPAPACASPFTSPDSPAKFCGTWLVEGGRLVQRVRHGAVGVLERVLRMHQTRRKLREKRHGAAQGQPQLTRRQRATRGNSTTSTSISQADRVGINMLMWGRARALIGCSGAPSPFAPIATGLTAAALRRPVLVLTLGPSC